jgi:hypothetical protein
MGEKYRTNVYLDRDVWNWLRKHAIDQNQSASEIIEELIRAYSKTIKTEDKKIPSTLKHSKLKKRS